jgi:hypothetical protein
MRSVLATVVFLAGSVCPVQEAAALQPAGRVLADEQLLHEAGLRADSQSLLKYFKDRTLSREQQQHLAAKTAQLGHDSYKLREQATADLIKAGESARPFLLAIVKSPGANLEAFRRAELCLNRLRKTDELARTAAAVRLLTHVRPEGAAGVLLNYLPFAGDEWMISEIQTALAALGIRAGVPEPTLVQALHDPMDIKRGSAAAALIHAGAKLPELSQLLHDPMPLVRFQAARALVDVKDKAGIPVLIDLMTRLPAPQVSEIEETLVRIAGEKSPAVVVSPGTSTAQVRQAWQAWWEASRAGLDLAKIDADNHLLGYTLISQLDGRGGTGRVFEIRANEKVLWQINGLRYPVDAQVIGPNRVLIAEYLNRQVTERDFKGHILWQYQVDMPINVQRLPNEQTFIATRRQLLIVDREGKVLFTHNAQLTSIAAARRLRDGQIVLVTSGGILQRLDARGRMTKSFHAGSVYALGGNIDILPGGRVLVPLYREHRVVEYDLEGAVRWQAKVQYPSSAVRLPNGNTLVVSMLRHHVVELTHDGNEVWSYRTDGRPWRARKR